MSNYKNDASARVTIDIDYARPFVNFPNLSGEFGNSRDYFKIAVDQLRISGFRRESKELDSHSKDPYGGHFNTIARFLDFNKIEVPSKDSEYTYFKIKKYDELTEQPRLFSLKSTSEIQELLEEGHDFSLKNCFGRNHAHYITDLESFKLLMEHNENKKWFDIFHLDVFKSTYLHGNRSLPLFAYILEEMHKDSPYLAERFLFGTNVFGENAFAEFLQKCDDIFSPNNNYPTVKMIEGVCDVITAVGKIDAKKRDQFLLFLDVIEKKNPEFKKQNGKQFILKMLLDSELKPNEIIPNKKSLKI